MHRSWPEGMLHAMRMAVVYALVILAEIILLTWRYATDPPSSSSAFSVGLGWGALISMVVMLVYSIARRSRKLRELARLSAWLQFHIFLGVQGLLFAIFHSLHLFTRAAPIQWMNPAFLNLLMVFVVFSSGVFGRYMYSLIPRTIGGEAMARKEVEAELAALGEAKQSDQDPRVRMLAKRRAQLERRLAHLAVASRIFQRWIILHRPIAGIMYVLSIVHVALSYMYTPSLGAG